jgi:Heavy-metal resistance protein CzcE
MHMFTLKQKGMLAALAACCTLSLAAPAQAESAAQYRSQFGASIDEGKYDREIVITADVRWVNVVAGQKIRFVIVDAAGGNAAFTWHFDTFGNRVADLSQLAPAGMVQRPVKIFIANDPRYEGA